MIWKLKHTQEREGTPPRVGWHMEEHGGISVRHTVHSGLWGVLRTRPTNARTEQTLQPDHLHHDCAESHAWKSHVGTLQSACDARVGAWVIIFPSVRPPFACFSSLFRYYPIIMWNRIGQGNFRIFGTLSVKKLEFGKTRVNHVSNHLDSHKQYLYEPLGISMHATIPIYLASRTKHMNMETMEMK